MEYEELIETISLIIENEKIKKNGLTLIYELDEVSHDKINQTLFSKSNPYSNNFEPSNEFEVMLGGILVKFKKM